MCTDPSPGRTEVGPSRRVRDAYAALAYLRTLPYVDGRRVGLMGGSHGGITTLAAMLAWAADAEPFAQDRRVGFAAAREAGYPVTIKIYPEAYHSFDSPYPLRYVAARVNANSPNGRGAMTGGNPDAWADSIREVAAFFGRHLMKTAN